MTVPDPIAASRAVIGHLADLLHAHPEWRQIALFAALPREPDLSELPALFPDRSFCYPRVSGQEMTFHRVINAPNDMIPGPWGLREPMPSLPEISAHEIDLMLCPGTAFTREGKRLGKGGGYYDRYLAAPRDRLPYLIGVTFAEFLLEDIPVEKNDTKMNAVICQSGVFIVA